MKSFSDIVVATLLCFCFFFNFPAAEAEIQRLSFSSNGTMLLPNGEVFNPGGWNWGHWGLNLPSDAALHVQEGANIVRIILRWWGLYGGSGIDAYDDSAPGHVNSSNLALLDSYIKQCENANLWINLAIDSNCGQNGAQNNETKLYCTIGGVPAQNFWSNLSMRSKFKEVWTFIASRYKNVSRIAWYEILPEPSPPSTYTDADVSSFYADMIPVLRAADPQTPVLIGGNAAYQANKISTVYDPSYVNVVYTSDFLDPVVRNPSNIAARLATILSFRNTTGSPLFVQQFGVKISSDPNTTLLSSGMQLMIDNQVGFTWWEYRGPAYPEYSVWWENNTVWTLKENVYAAIKSKLAIWATPVNASLSTSSSSSSSSGPNSSSASSLSSFFSFFLCQLLELF